MLQYLNLSDDVIDDLFLNIHNIDCGLKLLVDMVFRSGLYIIDTLVEQVLVAVDGDPVHFRVPGHVFTTFQHVHENRPPGEG